MYSRTHSSLATAIAAIASAALFAACDKPEESRTVGEQVDSAVSEVERRVNPESAGADKMDSPTTQAPGLPSETSVDQAKDQTISQAVMAAIAQDPKLQALRIEVDTINGRVALRGTVPDLESRERATALIASVSGVLAVDNQLTVEGKS